MYYLNFCPYSYNLHYEQIGKEVRCIEDEVPFEIPESWEWVRLSSVVYNHGQTKPEEDFCYIDIGSVDNQHQKLSAVETIIPPEKAPSRARKIICKDDIIYSTVRPYLHNMCIIDRNFSKMPIASTGFAVFTCHADFYNEFLFYYLMSPDFDSYANNVENSKGVAYPAINDTRLYKALIPLPPVDEQHRIVDKIKSVLPEIEKYDLVETELSNMNRDFPENLKRSILQWAVQGRLVPQDPSDEPAEVLLERIRTEKQRLVKEGKIKKDKHESITFRRDNSYYENINGKEHCIDDEIAFEIPDSWCWIRFKNLVHYSMGKTPPRKEEKYWINATNHWISISDMVSNGVICKTKELVNDYSAEHIFKNSISKKGTLIMSFKLTVGKVSILGIDSYHNEAIISIYPFVNDSLITRDYLFNTLPLLSQLGSTKKAIKGNTLNSSSLDNLLIPISSLNVQNKINKVIKQINDIL